MKNILKYYLIKKKEAWDIETIINTGLLTMEMADKIGNSKIIKPSEYEIEEFKDKCLNLKERLKDIIDKYNYINNPDDIINQINDLKFDKIRNCRKLGKIYFDIGTQIKDKEIHSNILSIFYKPVGLFYPITVLEGIVFPIILLIILKVIL